MENLSIVNSTHAAPYVLSKLDIIVGTTYIVEAIILILLHILCSYLMYTDKEMQNATYAFMINLSIVDCIELSMIGIYAGIVILTRYENAIIARIVGFVCIGFWYSNCALFALIAFSRWIMITQPHMTSRVFSRKMLWSLQAATWWVMGVVCFYGNVLYPPGPMFPFYPTVYTWDFDHNIELGRIFAWVNLVFNAICTIFEMSFNILSLHWVHKTRKTIQSVSTTENRKREIKLLVQCFILGCVFTATYIIFTTVYALNMASVALCLCVQAVWTFNHSVNPMVYLTVNRKLRGRTIKILTCGKFGNSKTKVTTVTIKSTVTALPSNFEH